MSLLSKLYNTHEGIAYWSSRLFPQRIEPTEQTMDLLGVMYPNVNWKSVQFFGDLPWYLSSKFTCAIVLPAFFSFRKINIYFSEFDEHSIKGKGTIIHEAYHVQQAQECGYGMGLGFFRIFLVSYLASFFERAFSFMKRGYSLTLVHLLAYQSHPMEEPAYYQEELCVNYLKACGINALNEEVPVNLIVRHSGHQADANPLLLVFTALLTIFLSILRLLGDLSLMIYCLLLWFSTQFNKGKSFLSVSK